MWLKTVTRVTFGIVWGFAGYLKFQPGFSDTIVSTVSNQAANQPSYLQPWFQFWSQIIASNPQLFVTSMGSIELLLSIALILGIMRKLTYTAGLVLSLLIWAIPEGFGGPYVAGATDIGTGFVYALVCTFLLIVNGAFGPSRYSVDFIIEQRWMGWKRIAEIQSSR